MGCGGSKQRQTVPAEEAAMMRKRGARASIVTGQVEKIVDAAAPAAQRLVASNGSVALEQPGAPFSLRYAHFSQRGYYPDAPDKTNQDAVRAAERLGGHADVHLFGVFDGHGEAGTECAQFVQDKLPDALASQPALATAPEAALHEALVSVNAQLHAAPGIDDSLSGTTACCALLRGATLHVANVGDSRAVMAEAGEGGALLARDLTQDQTPFRPDECLRVMKAGARVMTLDQLEGLKDPGLQCWSNEADCDGDPPRLWSPDGMFPGTAFTRSIGDSAAEDIGVIADPETCAVALAPHHRFAILATDGVWEFLSSQKAVELVAKYDAPLEAARALVAQAYKLWLQRETRTDDISAVVIFFDWPQEGKQAAAAAGGEAGAEVSEPQTPSSSPSKQSDGSAPGAPA